MPSREEAVALLHEFTQSDSLRKHALAVEVAMRAYAEKYGGDPDTWGLVGLLHDFDYERWPNPEEHPQKGALVLRQRGYPEEVIHAILCHAPYLGVEPRCAMDRAIFAVDELCGFITAVALVRPSKRLADVEVSSVKKKLKDKAFARTVNREDIYEGASRLGVDLDEHIAFVIEAMKKVAPELGL